MYVFSIDLPFKCGQSLSDGYEVESHIKNSVSDHSRKYSIWLHYGVIDTAVICPAVSLTML
jgi:hypothetical protein